MLIIYSNKMYDLINSIRMILINYLSGEIANYVVLGTLSSNIE